MVWLPTERIVFQGDLFYFEPAAIYGVHTTGAAGPDAIRHAAESPPTRR